MSEFTVVPPGSSLDNPLLTDDVGSDEVLQTIVATADDTDFHVGVTLAVQGTLITGILIGQDQWFRGLEMQHPELREPLTTPLRKQMVDEKEPGEIDPFESRFVHLKEARYLLGGGQYIPQIRATGFFWRGRISHVSAWSFGVISAAPSA